MSVARVEPVNDVEEVDLDAMPTADLLKERGDVVAAIAMIQAQLLDASRRPYPPEDESPAWIDYRDWRRRARWALAHHKRDLETIRQILRERTDQHTAARALRVTQWRTTDRDEMYLERVASFNAALEAMSDEALLLRAYRALRHLLAPYVNTFPDTIDESDRDAVVMLGTRLRRTYGASVMNRFIRTGEVQP